MVGVLVNASKQFCLLLERLQNVRVQDIFVNKAKKLMEVTSNRLHLEEAGIKQVLSFITEEFRFKAGTTVKIEQKGNCAYKVKDISDSTKTGKLSLHMHPNGYPLGFFLEGSLIDQYCAPPADSDLLDVEKAKQDSFERLEVKINGISSFDVGLRIVAMQMGCSNIFTESEFNLGKFYVESGGYCFAKYYSIRSTHRKQIIVKYERSYGLKSIYGKMYNSEI